MTARVWALPALVALALGIAGCVDTPEVTPYKHGEYKGKPDNLPWQSQPFNGNQHNWDLAIDGRTKNQNEYGRIGNQ
jgi:hypothetical protein